MLHFMKLNFYIENLPSIQLSPKNFYRGFGLEFPDTYDLFINETIYFPKVYFKKQKEREKIGNGM